MPDNTTKPTKAGSRTIRLADIDDDLRIREARRLMDDANTIDEFLRLIELAFWPGDAGGRIAD